MDKSLNVIFAATIDDVARAIDIDAVEQLSISPRRAAGARVVHEIRLSTEFQYSIAVSQVTSHKKGTVGREWNAIRIATARCHTVAAGCQCAGQVRTHEAGSSGHEHARGPQFARRCDKSGVHHRNSPAPIEMPAAVPRKSTRCPRWSRPSRCAIA